MPLTCDPAWPSRTRICLACRRTFSPLESCPGPGHRTRPLVSRFTRDLLDRQEHASRKRVHLGEWSVGAALSCGALFLLGNAFAGGVSIWAGVLLSLAAATWFRWTWFLRSVRAGALLPAPSIELVGDDGAAATREVSGVVGDGPVAPAPLSGEPCVAFAVTFRHDGRAGDPVSLRDGATLGFSIECDDGQVVMVPRGPIELTAPRPRAGFADDRVERYLATVDPMRKRSDQEPFPRDEVREALICIGDRVVLRNPVDTAPDPAAEPTHYRAPAKARQAPRGTPVVEVCDAAPARGV